MKLKQQPEDFRVEELTDVRVGQGNFAFYRLEKKGWTTPDALQAVRRRWKITHQRLSYGGLKDRHAHTIQFFTILRGPQRRLTHHDVHVEYIGQVSRPYTSRDIRANRFEIAVRDLRPDDIRLAEDMLREVAAQGVPNYFDDQRFGSAADPEKFVARAIIQGDYERALRLALAEAYEHDRAAARKEKAILRNCWGDWARCKEQLPRGHARSLADYLAHHPDDYKGAVLRLRPELRGLYLSAYQSFLWNRMLARWLHDHCPAEQLVSVRLRLGSVPMHRHLDADSFQALQPLSLPLPNARHPFEADDPRAELMDAILHEDGLQREQLKLKGFRDLFFSKGERAALCMPAELRWRRGTDEKNPGRQKLTLDFELPRGAYATLVVKRMATWPPGTHDSSKPEA
jgi:tRNA pseudouridine13 synthase